MKNSFFQQNGVLGPNKDFQDFIQSAQTYGFTILDQNVSFIHQNIFLRCCVW